MEIKIVVVICITVVILALIAAATFLFSWYIEEHVDKQEVKQLRQEMAHLQKQSNNMYTLYRELKEKIDMIN